MQIKIIGIIVISILISIKILSQSSGTGFLISNDGYIVTCYHVIDNSKEILIKGINGDFIKQYKASVVATDKIADLAILKVSCTLIKPISYSISWNSIEVGQEIFTLGYPLKTTMGEEIKLTNGIISSKSGFRGDISTYQISAPIQPGNSGGPLFDKAGNVVGIISARHLGTDNVGYAIKTNLLRYLIQATPENIELTRLNLLFGKALTEQTKLAKNHIIIIEVENNSISPKINPIIIKTKIEAKLKMGPDALSDVIGYIPSNTLVELLGKYGNYWKIFYSGKIGYSHDMYFEETYETFKIKESEKFSKIPTEYQKNNEIATINNEAKMRNMPSPLSNIIKYIPKGEIIYVVGFSEGYWKIFYNGSEGFIIDGLYFDVTYKMMRFKKP